MLTSTARILPRVLPHTVWKMNVKRDTDDEISEIRELLQTTPLNHIGIIPDGNRRWAKEKGLSIEEGHNIGASNAFNLSDSIFKIGLIHSASIYGCSTDNLLKRGQNEVDNICDVLKHFMLKFSEDSASKYRVKMNHLGDRRILPHHLIEIIDFVEDKTKYYNHHILNMCIGYDGLKDICLAINKLTPNEIKTIDPDLLMEHLYGDSQENLKYPNIDLVIRTGKVQRISKFMTFQAANAEYCFLDRHFPEFDENALFSAIKGYCNVQRRFGK